MIPATFLEEKSYNALTLASSANYELLKKFYDLNGSWQRAWQRLKKSNAEAAAIDAETEWQKLENHKVRLILRADPEFPKELKEIPWCPFGLYLSGAKLEALPRLAIVGTRKASPQGRALAKNFARQLAEAGLVIVSGLALGIDRAAHEGALEAPGKTIAVLATGLDRTYPREHESLAKKILSLGGTLISEYPIGAPALSYRFLERNRLISGLALGVIIVEAPNDSGALATARFALEQNREVFVVPGPVDHPNYVGSNELIKAGAALITSSADVFTSLNLENLRATLAQSRLTLGGAELDENQKSVINILKTGGARLAIDKIAELAKMEVPMVSRALGFLTVKGIVKEESGQYYL